MSAGPVFLASLFFLGATVCVVYTLAKEVPASRQQLTRSVLHRGARLFGVLAVLAVLVYFFSII